MGLDVRLRLDLNLISSILNVPGRIVIEIEGTSSGWQVTQMEGATSSNGFLNLFLRGIGLRDIVIEFGSSAQHSLFGVEIGLHDFLRLLLIKQVDGYCLLLMLDQWYRYLLSLAEVSSLFYIIFDYCYGSTPIYHTSHHLILFPNQHLRLFLYNYLKIFTPVKDFRVNFL